MMKELWNMVLGDSIKVTVDDTLGSDNNEAFCDTYHNEIQGMLNAMNSSAISKKFILSSQMSAGKLRDWLKTGRDCFGDTFDVIEKIIIANNSINTTTAKAIGVSVADYNSIKTGSDNAFSSLKQLVKNSDFSMIHDVAMKLVKVGDKEMLAIENQGQYEGLESKESSESLGYTLFFPKLFSDTFALGTQNGWCVSSSPEIYSKNVREGKAILVGIAPIGKYKNKASSIEAVEALLYVLFNRKGDMESYQIKMSSMFAKDLSCKMPEGTNRNLTIGREETPPEDRYPIHKIIRMVQEVRVNLEKDDKKAA
jgi:hypothetical protein